MKNIQLPLFIIIFLFVTSGLSTQCFTEQTFITSGQSTYTIPGTAGQSYLIEIETKGADGGGFLWSRNPQTDGDEGATMKASFIVLGGSDLLVVVGASGFDALGSPGDGRGSVMILDNSDVLIAAGAGDGGGQGGRSTGQGGQANTNSPAVSGLELDFRIIKILIC